MSIFKPDPDLFNADHLGSTAALSDAAGNVVEQESYDSFGNSAGSARTRYGYTGRERDPDTGMLYYRARFYDSEVGRFIGEDPIGFHGRDINFYAYVKNRPLLMIDPSGLRRCNPIVGGIVGGLLGAIGGAGTGAGIGAGAAATVGALGGTLVIPGFGTIAGGGVGLGAGASAGAYFGSAIGAGIGIGAGIEYCNKECDEPRVLPFPKVEPIPVPPPKDEDDCRMRLVQCLRFARTDPRRSEECMSAYKNCLEQLKK